MKKRKLNHYEKVIKSGLDIESTIWNIFNRLDEYFYEFEKYLDKFVEHGIIEKKDKQDFIIGFWKQLENKVLIKAVKEAEERMLGKEYLTEKIKVIKNIEKRLDTLKKKTRKEIQNTFTPLIIYHVGFSNRSKSKNTKRYKSKKPGRPKLVG